MATITYNTEIAELAASFGTVPAPKAPSAPKCVVQSYTARPAELAMLPQFSRALMAKYSTDDKVFALAA